MANPYTHCLACGAVIPSTDSIHYDISMCSDFISEQTKD